MQAGLQEQLAQTAYEGQATRQTIGQAAVALAQHFSKESQASRELTLRCHQELVGVVVKGFTAQMQLMAERSLVQEGQLQHISGQLQQITEVLQDIRQTLVHQQCFQANEDFLVGMQYLKHLRLQDAQQQFGDDSGLEKEKDSRKDSFLSSILKIFKPRRVHNYYSGYCPAYIPHYYPDAWILNVTINVTLKGNLTTNGIEIGFFLNYNLLSTASCDEWGKASLCKRFHNTEQFIPKNGDKLTVRIKGMAIEDEIVLTLDNSRCGRMA